MHSEGYDEAQGRDGEKGKSTQDWMGSMEKLEKEKPPSSNRSHCELHAGQAGGSLEGRGRGRGGGRGRKGDQREGQQEGGKEFWECQHWA